MPALVATAAVGLTACTASEGDSQDEAAADASQGVYGTPADPDRPEPTDVATDPPVTLAPTADGTIQITYAGWNAEASTVEVAGFLPGAVESDGTCTLTLTNAGSSVAATVAGSPDASSTSCGGLVVPGASISPGTWTAVVSYQSSTSRGTSEPTRVVVP
jgi:hypothetical protein